MNERLLPFVPTFPIAQRFCLFHDRFQFDFKTKTVLKRSETVKNVHENGQVRSRIKIERSTVKVLKDVVD